MPAVPGEHAAVRQQAPCIPTFTSPSLGVQHPQHFNFAACTEGIKLILLWCLVLQPREQACRLTVAVWGLSPPQISAHPPHCPFMYKVRETQLYS